MLLVPSRRTVTIDQRTDYLQKRSVGYVRTPTRPFGYDHATEARFITSHALGQRS